MKPKNRSFNLKTIGPVSCNGKDSYQDISYTLLNMVAMVASLRKRKIRKMVPVITAIRTKNQQTK